MRRIVAAASAWIACSAGFANAQAGDALNTPSATTRGGAIYFTIGRTSGVAMGVARYASGRVDTLRTLLMSNERYNARAVALAAEAAPGHQLQAFTASGEAGVQQTQYDSTQGWLEWHQIKNFGSGDAMPTAGRVAAATYEGKIYVAVRDTGGGLWYASGTGNDFTPFARIPGAPTGTASPSLAAGPDGLHLITADGAGSISRTSFNGHAWGTWRPFTCCTRRAQFGDSNGGYSVSWLRDSTYLVTYLDQTTVMERTYAGTSTLGTAVAVASGTAVSPAIASDSAGTMTMFLFTSTGATAVGRRDAGGNWTSVARTGPTLVAWSPPPGVLVPPTYAEAQSPSATTMKGAVYFATTNPAAPGPKQKISTGFANAAVVDTLQMMSFDPDWSFDGAVVIAGDTVAGVLHAFTTSKTGAVLHSRYQDGSRGSTGWMTWANLGATVQSRVAATFYAGKIYLFAKTGDQLSYLSGTGDQFSALTAIPATGLSMVLTGPGAAAGADGIRVVARGADNNVYMTTFNGSSWSNWSSYGGNTMRGDPAVVWMSGTRYELAARGTDNAIWTRTTDAQAAWTRMGGQTSFSPALVRDGSGSGSAAMFVLGTDNRSYMSTRSATGAWSTFGSVAKTGTGSVAQYQALGTQISAANADNPQLTAGQYLVAADSAAMALLQPDGRLCLYRGTNPARLGTPTWCSSASSQGSALDTLRVTTTGMAINPPSRPNVPNAPVWTAPFGASSDLPASALRLANRPGTNTPALMAFADGCDRPLWSSDSGSAPGACPITSKSNSGLAFKNYAPFGLQVWVHYVFNACDTKWLHVNPARTDRSGKTIPGEVDGNGAWLNGCLVLRIVVEPDKGAPAVNVDNYYANLGSAQKTYYFLAESDQSTNNSWRMMSANEAPVPDQGTDGKSPGFAITNETRWPVAVALEQDGCLYHDVLKPGASMNRNTGAVWFTIWASIVPDGKDPNNDLTCWSPILQTVASVLQGALMGGVPGWASFAGSAVGLTTVQAPAAMFVTEAMVKGAAVAVGKELLDRTVAAITDTLSKNMSLKVYGQYAGPDWPFRCDLKPQYTIRGGWGNTGYEDGKFLIDPGSPLIIRKTNSCGDTMMLGAALKAVKP